MATGYYQPSGAGVRIWDFTTGSGTEAGRSGDSSQDATMTKKKRTRIAVHIVFPIFAECAELVTDAYWKKKFTDMSKGRMPKKFAYTREGILSYGTGPRANWIRLSPSKYEAVSACMQFLKTFGGLSSDKDQAAFHQNISPMEEVVPSTWSLLKKSAKEMYVAKFIHNLTLRLKLNEKQVRSLSDTINLGIQLKYFNNSSIIIQDRNIVTINGLLQNHDGDFLINPDMKPTSGSKSSSSKKEDVVPIPPFVGDYSGGYYIHNLDMYPTYGKTWSKFIDGLEAKTYTKPVDQSAPMIKFSAECFARGITTTGRVDGSGKGGTITIGGRIVIPSHKTEDATGTTSTGGSGFRESSV